LLHLGSVHRRLLNLQGFFGVSCVFLAASRRFYTIDHYRISTCDFFSRPYIEITDGKVHDVNILDELVPEPGSFYIMDRGYIDFARLYRLTQFCAFFVTRAKTNLQFRRLYSHPVDKTAGLQSDQTIVLSGFYAAKDYPDKLRRTRYYDAETDKALTFLSNNFLIPALTVAQLYKCRWQVELFFRWIKQHLRIKAFYGTSANAVKTQIWVAISVYVLVAIIKKRLQQEMNLYTILQILSVTAFEQVPITQVLMNFDYRSTEGDSCKQLLLQDL
jgi:IS4 transposase